MNPSVRCRDDHLVATVHGKQPDLQLKIWNVVSRTQLGTSLAGHRTGVLALAFTPDGRSLVSVDRVGSFRVHTIDPDRLKDELCEKAGALTDDEWKARIPDVPYRSTC